jgi:hypothetical protein
MFGAINCDKNVFKHPNSVGHFVYIKSLLRNHGVSCIISKHFCMNSLSRLEHPYEMQKHSAIVVGAIAVRVGGL